MAAIHIQDEGLVERLRAMAARENRPIEELLHALLDQYTRRREAFEAMAGMFDDDITNLSTSVRETIDTYYRQQDDRSD